MIASPTVFIDPDGTLADGWMFVIVEHPTGVWYEHQYGGTACRQGRMQGYLVPVDGRVVRPELDDLFVRELGGVGLWGGTKAPSVTILDRLALLVGNVRFWESIRDAPEPRSLVLDLGRAVDVDEAWLPVLTPDGPGTLVWLNSD